MPGYVAAKGGPSTPLLPDSCGTPTDDAAYVADITLPDGTVVSPGQNATKTWQLRNSGTSTWGTGYQLAFVNGNQLGAPASVSVPAAAPGQLANVSVPLQIPANITGGTYQGNWRMRNASGTYFGDTIYVRVSVSQAQPTPPGGGGGGNGVNVDLVGIANSPSAPDPGQRFQPEITVRVTSGQLLASRGDLLRLYSGTNYTSPSFPHVAVQGTINSGQTFTFRFYDDHPMVAPTAPGTYEGVWRVWANSGWVGPEIPIRFTVGQPNQGHPPNAPNLVSPYDWQLFVGQTPQLCAHDNGDPDGDAITGYHFVVWSSVGGTRDSGWVSGSCWTPPNLGNYGWTWHAQVQDSRGLVSDWSPTWHFNLESSTVTITDMHFDPASPSNGQTITCYACTSGCGGVGVTLKVLVNTATDGSANGQWIILKELGVPCFTQPDAPRWDTLEYGDGVHLVRTEATSCDGTVVHADRQYTLTRRIPSRPFLLSPSNQFWSNSRTLTFNWQAAARATGYTLIVGTTPDPEQAPLRTVQLTTTSYTTTFDQDYPRLYWRVYANNELGRTAQDGWWVGIDRTPPTSAVQAIGVPSVVYETQFALAWTGSDGDSGFQNYDIQVDRDGMGQWTDWLTSYSYPSAIFSGQPGHTYCFRSRGHDIAGNTEAYPATADTCVQVDPTQRPPQQWWNTGYTGKRNLVIANRVATAVLPIGYPVQLHFDASTSPTAAEIYNASLTTTRGDDVRLVYQDQTELARHVIQFSPTVVDLWFPIQADIAPSGSSSAYSLYYGNALAGAPPANPANVYAPPPDSATKALWYFEEPAGPAGDSSGHNNSVAWSSEPEHGLNDGLHGSGVRLDGSKWGTVSANPTIGDQLTVEGWVMFDALTNPPGGTGYWTGVIAKYSAADHANRWRITLFNQSQDPNSQRMTAQLETIEANGTRHGYGIVWDTPLQTARWYHVALTYDGSRVHFWVDGTEVGSTAAVGRVNDQGEAILVGRNHPTDPPLIGRLDGFRVSNVARTTFPYAKITVLPSAAAGGPITRQTLGPTDLVLQNIQASPDADGSLIVQAAVQNQGTNSSYNEFYIHLYRDHVPTGPGDLTGSIGFWSNAPITPGATLTLTRVLTQGQLLRQSNGTMPLGDQAFTLAGQVDSTGTVSDTNRSNNILTGIPVCITTPDIYEGDDTAAGAHILLLGQAQTHNFDRAGDTDWLKFTASAGQVLTMSTTNLGAAADTYLYLYDTDSTSLLAANDDAAGSLASSIQWTAPAAGVYYLRVQHWNPTAAGCATNYDVRVADSSSGGCGTSFTDVTDPTAYYYTPVYYLACHGVISGYSDGTFKPFNNTTRGQLSKIVVLAEALPIQTPAAGGNTFADVLPGSTFFPYIETAAARGIVSGYACGGINPQSNAAEPCDSVHRPYYRPSNNVTRGQLAKIVVISAGWPLLNPATPTFTDVPNANVFYPFIQTAVCHGIISGYSDQTFRPSNSATRGQIAKIVYLAVVPGTTCSTAAP